MKPRLSQRIQFSLAYALVVVVLLSLLQSWLLAAKEEKWTVPGYEVGL